MKTTIGEQARSKSWQVEFPATVKCSKKGCKGEARIAFVAYEGMSDDDKKEFVCHLHLNEGEGGYWPHDAIAVAVYLCRKCLGATALFNQA